MKNILFFVGFCLLFGTQGWGQTNPVQQSLPFAFSSQSGSTLPAGIAVHRFGTTAGTIPLTRTLNPGNADLPHTSTNTFGGWKDEGENGISMLASSSQAAGAIVVAINTIGLTNVQVSWICRTILQQASRDNSFALQYRVGVSGDFTDIGTTSTYSSAGQTSGHVSSTYTENLPSAADNQPIVQVRWIYWESFGATGARDRLALDEVSIKANNTFYSKSSGNLNDVANWGTSTDGSGTAPVNFSTDFQGFVIKNNATPTIGTDWTVSGTNSKIIVGDGTNACNFTAAYNVSTPDLEIKTNGVITISPSKSLTVSGTLTNNASEGIVLSSPSDHGAPGSLIMAGTYTGSGTIKAERYITAYTGASDGWHLLSSPVNTFTISSTNIAPGANDDLYWYSETDNEWKNYKTSAFNTMTNGQAYLCAYEASATKSFSGTPNNADITFSNLSFTNSRGWHSLGNPFQSAMIWNDGNWALNNISTTAKYLNSGGTYSNLTANDIIPCMQGFMVNATSTSNSITLSKSSRTHNSTAWYKNGQNLNGKFRIRTASLNDDTYVEVDVLLQPSSSFGFDELTDSKFIPGMSGTPKLYFKIDNESLSLNAIPREEGQYNLGFMKGNTDYYHLTATGFESLSSNTQVILYDLKMGSAHNLSANPSYSFTSTTSDDPNRFKLTFASVGVENPQTENPSVYTYGNQIYVKGQGTALVELYNMSGQRIYAVQTQLTGITPIPFRASAGYYLVRIISDRNVQTSKILLNN